MESKPFVFITGITGFVASQIAKLLLTKGYNVKGSVRSLSNKNKILPIQSLPNSQNLQLIEANLLTADCWGTAIKGSDVVMHVASPFPHDTPKNESDLLRPAVEGTLNVLKACTQNHVKQVILTSSIAAIMGYGKQNLGIYDETVFCDPNNVPVYNKSKVLAEKAAWDYYNTLPKDNRFQMSVINPSLVMGPTLVKTDFSSGELVRSLLMGEIPYIAKVQFNLVDVEDVALAHFNAMLSSSSDGQRYICDSGQPLWLKDVCNILYKEFHQYGYKIPQKEIRFCTVKLASLFSKRLRPVVHIWNCERKFNNMKIQKELGIKFISSEEAIKRMAYSLIDMGIVPNKMVRK